MAEPALILLDVMMPLRFANTSVLIQGESGTGEELVSRAIHHGSTRSAAPFIPVNCVAVPAELAKSMLLESGGEPIRRCHIHLLEVVPRRQTASQVAAGPSSETIPLNLDAAEQVLIQRALNQSGGNVAEAARLLGVNRSRIYRRFPNQV
jgi:DNA-binding NtrC family response regulator